MLLLICDICFKFQELSQIRGPFSFIYFRPKTRKIWYGRDFFGRHSLLVESGPDHFVLTSVGHKSLNRWGNQTLPKGKNVLNEAKILV